MSWWRWDGLTSAFFEWMDGPHLCAGAEAYGAIRYIPTPEQPGPVATEGGVAGRHTVVISQWEARLELLRDRFSGCTMGACASSKGLAYSEEANASIEEAGGGAFSRQMRAEVTRVGVVSMHMRLLAYIWFLRRSPDKGERGKVSENDPILEL
jgi:hypothetical protein